MNTKTNTTTAASRLEPFGYRATEIRPMYLDGQWVYGAGEPFDCICPIDGSVVTQIASANPADVARATVAAAAAFDGGAWSRRPAHTRARLLTAVADQIEAQADRLATIQTVDVGKPLHESLAQVSGAAQVFRYYAALVETMESAVPAARGDYFAFTTYEPVGVVAAITPWNSPLTLEAQKLAPALAAGNSVVQKPSEVSPLISLEYARIFEECGLPKGVLNVLQGTGISAGAPLVEDPHVSMVSFTGGVSTGRAIAETAGRRLIPAVVELGGKSPNIVFDDADLDAAVDGVVYAIFSNSGQSCIAGSRIFVQNGIYEKFTKRVAERTAALVVGDPFEAETRVAPLASFHHRDHVQASIDAGLEQGARVLAGGTPLNRAPYADGAYVSPTLLEIDSNEWDIAQREIFGPVGVVLRFTDEFDLIAQANKSDFGLACAMWTADYRKALRVARDLKAGIQWINTYKITPPNMPFGGFKDSGIWRECGQDGLRPYLEVKSVYMSTASEPFSWR